MGVAYVVAIALATIVAVAAVVVFTLKRMFLRHRAAGPDDAWVRRLDIDDLTLRDVKADLERRLAFGEQKAARPLEMERNVSGRSMLPGALREEIAEAERKLIAASEALNQTKTPLGQAQARLSEQVLEAQDFAQRRERLKDTKAALGQNLAARTEALSRVTEALSHVDASANDLRVRLAEVENAQQETVPRPEASRAEAEDLPIKCARSQETLDQVTKQSEEKLALLNSEEKLTLLNKAKDRMMQEFELFAEEVIKLHGEEFTKQNKEQVDERRNRNAEAIAEQAGRLYDEFFDFLGHMHDLVNRLGKAQESYDSAMAKLSTCRGDLMRQVEQLREMGVKTSKSLPEALPGDIQTQALRSSRNVDA